ncbi:AzlC family ABC transporter permease [Marinobacterium stanieri]|uniref:AzlC family ABC transporter permease n=1 Tax=Marinobacterium stanieri TaxID=49186 RepID=UPI0002557C63|nr:AzlC family ABC transporter permease [Marinobacterium stanieri]
MTNTQYPIQQMKTGTRLILPLTIAVIPWGLLVGAYGVESGLSAVQTQLLSLSVFAGASQLVAIGMLESCAGVASILLTTLLITSRHFLSGLALRQDIQHLPAPWRVSLGFLLTDELFIIRHRHEKRFCRWFLIGAGASFYLGWNLATLAGILAGQYLPDLSSLGLDFAVVAIFIVLLVPILKHRAAWVCVTASAITAVVTHLLQLPGGLLVAM